MEVELGINNGLIYVAWVNKKKRERTLQYSYHARCEQHCLRTFEFEFDIDTGCGLTNMTIYDSFTKLEFVHSKMELLLGFHVDNSDDKTKAKQTIQSHKRELQILPILSLMVGPDN